LPTTVANLNVKVGGDTSEAKGKLNELSGHVNTVGGHFKSALGSILGFAGGALAIGGVTMAAGFLVGQMKDVITQGMSQQKVMTETSNVLAHMGNVSGQTSQSIGDYADHMAQLTGVSDDVIQHSENVMLTFGNLGKNIFPQAETAALNMSTMLGTDLQGSVIQVGKALNDPIKGIASLSREGVSFSQVEKDNIKTMMAHNNIAGAQAIVMGELNKQFGGAAVSAGTTFGGAMSRLNVIVDQAKEKLGLALLPILGKILTAIMPLVTQFGAALPGAMAALTDFVSKNVSPVIDRLASFVRGDLIPVLVSLGGFIIRNVVPTLIQLATWFQGHIVPILLVLFSVIRNNVMPALAQVWQSISSNLIPAIQNLWNKLSPVLIPVLKLVGWTLQNVVGPALSLVIGIIGKLIDFLAMAIGKLGDFLGFLGHVKDAVGGALSGVGNALHGAHIPGFAVGGVMAQSGLAMVGEHGPEVVALPQGARVYPHGTGPTGGHTYNITMHGTNLTVQDLQRELWVQAVLHG
jgi:hypothetical protein